MRRKKILSVIALLSLLFALFAVFPVNGVYGNMKPIGGGDGGGGGGCSACVTCVVGIPPAQQTRNACCSVSGCSGLADCYVYGTNQVICECNHVMVGHGSC